MVFIQKLLQLLKTNLIMVFNAGSLVGTTAVTSLLGFAYWWVAARFYTPNAVGLASAMISAMTLLGTVSMLGLGTLLTGELAHRQGREWALIHTALIVVGGTGTIAGLAFVLIIPFIAPDLAFIRANLFNSVLFALGVGFTALTMVLDQAFIGILRGDLQFWRNTLFASIKLFTLFTAGYFLSAGTGLIIYGTWLAGNILSLIILFAGQKRRSSMQEAPEKRAFSGLLAGLEESIRLPCPDCGELSPKSARFCAKCGYPLSPTVEMASVRPQLLFEYGALGLPKTPECERQKAIPGNWCPECEHEAPDLARFCVACGYPLTPTMKIASLKGELFAQGGEKEPASAAPERHRESRNSSAWGSPDQQEPEQAGSGPPFSHPSPVGENSAWSLLYKLGKAALQHHLLNLILLVPPLILPVLVTVQLSATENAWFYVSFMLANFIFSLTYALSTVLYAISAAQPAVLVQKIRFTLSLSFITGLGANLILQPGAGLLLEIFGHAYANEAAGCLRILSLAVFPLIIISHYIALCRIQNRITSVILPVAIGTIVELGGAAIGARIYGLAGLSSGWLAGLILEALYMVRAVYKAAYPVNALPLTGKEPHTTPL